MRLVAGSAGVGDHHADGIALLVERKARPLRLRAGDEFVQS